MPKVADVLDLARERSKGERVRAGKRFKEIVSILMKHDLQRGLSPEKAVDILQDLGAVFVKLGQIASAHPDVLPPEYCEALGKLRANADPMDFATVKAQVEEQLGRPMGEVFASFSETCIGAASIAQVHRAELLDGRTVAVKVQRPGVVEQVTNDLAIMERIVDLYSLVDRGNAGISFKELVRELVNTSLAELDFEDEAAHIDRFYDNNKGRAGVRVPVCYHDLTTPAMLVEEFFEGSNAEDIDELGFSAAEREQLGYRIADNYVTQIMEDGFYHADPHAGNIMLLGDGAFAWVDFGIMGTVTPSQREKLQKILEAMVKGDAYALERALSRVVRPRGNVDHAAFLALCEDILHEFVDTDLESFDTAGFVDEVLGAMSKQGFDVDPFAVNLVRGLVTLEGTCHMICPTMDIMRVLSRYAVREFTPERLQKRFRHFSARSLESAETMAGMPVKLSDLIDMLQRGQTKVGLELSSTDEFSMDLRAAAGLISLGLVAMALILGACLVGALTNAFPVFGVSIFTLMGIFIGVGMTVYIMIKVRPYL